MILGALLYCYFRTVSMLSAPRYDAPSSPAQHRAVFRNNVLPRCAPSCRSISADPCGRRAVNSSRIRTRRQRRRCELLERCSQLQLQAKASVAMQQPIQCCYFCWPPYARCRPPETPTARGLGVQSPERARLIAGNDSDRTTVRGA